MEMLNNTQMAILAKVIEGKTNSEIASELNYSKRNIKYHLEKIYAYYKISTQNQYNRRALLIKEVTRQELEKYM